MSIPQKLKGRYEIREILGQGGMGVVFRATDSVVRRDVALKTLRDAPNRAALQMFLKECEVLAALSHPNIIEIFDIGEYDEDGKTKPYFVMPLLPGATLDKLIKTSSHRLTVERVVEIITQSCRGLHAAHERGLVHRDIKPSNLWVMDDDSVKIIDFGVAHMVEAAQSVGAKGTLLYMAPEQLQMKPATPASDVYALGVTAYEALTRRRPFEGPTEKDIVDAVLNLIPPSASDLNPAVSQILGRVVHKAMAKQPWNRYANAREFADTLQKGMRGEPIEFFNPARIQPRIERATKAFESGDLQFASEILSELEAEGHCEPALNSLRRQIEHMRRQKTIGQLLESARTRLEHEEYPLALQKIQDILLLDPANAQALGLRASIENRQIAQKVEQWLQLARQHLENQAFSHAREALRNVLQLKPNEPRAVQLLAEIDREEQEYIRVRKEKEELYNSALEAWNSGEVSSALSKLERVIDLDHRVPEAAASDRSASYQNFYNKVRSEHESLKNSYAEARKLLSDGNFAQAAAIADEWLKKYPGHALFQALRFDVEEQKRQELSQRIAEVDRQLEAEPDIDRKVGLLEEAVAAYPGEPHFERQLRPMRERRDLVNSIVAKARYHEERGQFNEALAQWEILGTIYTQYPGLNFEIERVIKRREQQARSDAKARWLDQIEQAMSARDYERAASLADSAAAEFPGDTEMEQAKERARQAGQNAVEADKLLAQGQALCQQEWFDEGIGAMRRALELEPRNPAIRAALLDTLTERARVVMNTDWGAAEPFIQQALAIDPNNVLAKSLRTAVQDHRRDEAVIRCFTQARQYRAAGDLQSALKEAEQCLAAYPLDPRLAQLRDILQKELGEAQTLASRPADLEALKQLEQDALAAGEWADPHAVLDKARTLAGRYPEDAEFKTAVTGLEQRLSSARSERKAAVENTLPNDADLTIAAPVPEEPTVTHVRLPSSAAMAPPATPPAAAPPPAAPTPPPAAAAPVKPAKPAEPVKTAKPAAPPKPARQGKGSSRTAMIGIAAGVLLVAGAVAAALLLRRAGPPPAGELRVEVRTTPPGAVVRVNGKIRGTSNFSLEVAPGAYQLEATLEGYQPALATANIAAGAAGPIEIALQPLPQTLRLITDLPEGKVTLDDQPPRDLQDGQLTLDAVPPGKHTLKVVARSGEAELGFEFAPGAVPVIGAPPVVKNVAALLVSSFGNRARVYSSVAQAKVELDGRPAGDLTAEGLALANATPGTHDLALSDGKLSLKKVVEFGPTPVLTAFLQTDQNVGTLVILTGEDGVDVYIDGKKYRRQTARGQLRVQREPKEYRIRVTKQGFQDAGEQTVQIAKGEEKKVVFKLAPLPTIAQLSVRGTPGAEVLLDQNVIGTVQSDGTFQSGSIAPGERTLELRNGRRRSRAVKKTFVAGQTVTVAESELALRALTGTLRLSVTPPGAQVTISPAAGGPPQNAGGNTVELEEGNYTVTARAPGYTEKSDKVRIVAGQTAPLALALAAVAKTRTAGPLGMEGFEGGGWKQEGEWYVHRGGNFVLFKPQSATGTYAFNIMLGAGGGVFGGRHLEWVVDYVNDRNYMLFRIDKDNFRRFQIVDGRRTEMVRKAHGIPMKDFLLGSIQVEVTPGSITHRGRKNDQWVVLDSWTPQGPSLQGGAPPNFTQGRFGLVIPPNYEVRLSGFGFYPKE